MQYLQSDSKISSKDDARFLRSSTRSSNNSFQLLSPASSPKSSTSMSHFSFIEKAEAIDEKTSNRSVNKVKNFQSAYLAEGIWPDIEGKDQAKFKAEYRGMRDRLHIKSEKIRMLKKEIVRNKEECPNCLEWKKKNESTQNALKQAIDLSNMLLIEMKKKG
jgi:hypothetical protein